MAERKRITSRDQAGPRQLGPYILQSMLAKGGMGEVYLGQHATLHTHAAIKVLRSDLSDSAEFIERFRKEAQALARVSHPNVVQVLDVRREGKVTYIAMEYAAGMDLRRWLGRDGQIGRELLLNVSRQLMDGIAAAHEAGLLHRDIKPDNILVDHLGNVRITDFGIADDARLQPGGTERQKFATIAYAAPEVLKGEASTKASDVFSICATIYHLATGKPPFGTTSRSSVLAAQTRGCRPVQTLREDLPLDFCEEVMAGLAVDVTLRAADAAELRDRFFASGRRRGGLLRWKLVAALILAASGSLAGWLSAPKTNSLPLPAPNPSERSTTPSLDEPSGVTAQATSAAEQTPSQRYAEQRQNAATQAWQQEVAELAMIERSLEPDRRLARISRFAAQWQGTTAGERAAALAAEERVLRDRRRLSHLSSGQPRSLVLLVDSDASSIEIDLGTVTDSKAAPAASDTQGLMLAQRGQLLPYAEVQRLNETFAQPSRIVDEGVLVEKASQAFGAESVEAGLFQRACRGEAFDEVLAKPPTKQAWRLRNRFVADPYGYLAAARELPDWAVDLGLALRDRAVHTDEASGERLLRLLPTSAAAVAIRLRKGVKADPDGNVLWRLMSAENNE